MARTADTRRRPPRRGFGLLEAIVALALLAGAAALVFDWLRSNLQTAARLQQAEREARLMAAGSRWVDALNPSLRPEGELTTTGLRLRWRSERVLDERPNASLIPGQGGPWQLALYRVEVEADDGAGEPVRFSQLQVGQRRSRPAASGL